jgi:putative membrane protein
MEKTAFERFYSKAFTLPKKRISVVLGAITIVLASIQYGIARTFFAERYLFLALTFLIALALSGKLLGLAFDGRRIFFFALVLLIFIELFDFIVYHVGLPYMIALTPAFLSALLVIIFFFSSDVTESKVFATAFIMLLLIYPFNYLFSFDAPSRSHIYVLTGSYILINIIGLLAGFFYLRFFDRDFGFNIKSFIRSFFLFWLTDDPLPVENELEKLGKTQHGWIRCISIGDIHLVANSYHPGPFRAVGGAKLVDAILAKGKTMYLHSATTHDKNIVSTREVERLVSCMRCQGAKLNAMEPYQLESENFKASVLPFDKLKLIILSGRQAIDDLPSELQDYADKMGEILVVDAHNAYEKGYTATPEDLTQIKDLIGQAARIKSNPSPLKAAFVKTKVDSANICGYLALLLLDYGSTKYGIFMIDSNNIQREFRASIERHLERKGVTPVVISTDNHAKTGVPPKLEYHPAGADETDVTAVFDFLETIDVSKTAVVDDIRSDKQPAAIQVFGQDFIDNAEAAMETLGTKAVFLFFFIIFLQILLASGFGLLLAGI